MKLVPSIAAAAALALLAAANTHAAEIPKNYPTEYKDIVEASKAENDLIIYSNLSDFNWKPIVEKFNSLYPWIKVKALQLGTLEGFTRYEIESGSGARSADMLALGSIDGWLEFLKKPDSINRYESPERAHVPKWSIPFPGLYTMSTDPMIMVYNKLVVPKDEQPSSLADVIKATQARPAFYKNGLTSYSGVGSYGQPIYLSWTMKDGDKAWNSIEALARFTQPEESGGSMLAKLSSGEYKVGYFLSGITFFPKMGGAQDKLLGWAFPKDGTPVVLRGTAITGKARSVNSAKLMLDFILSEQGQKAISQGGLTPYRPGLPKDAIRYFSYDSIAEQIGEENIILVSYADKFLERVAEFRERYKVIKGH
ncbi:Extracellular solute-binding protein [Hyphomicrobiales bacterium]|nr:Extracellular solute-binding protein [Hyphomicrobiales bacterium]CAH1693495.1 Extracellular solute-binding protein [Hyphomicrobiales bacterium]